MTLLTKPRTRAVDAAMAALRCAGEQSAELRTRLDECDSKRFHLHRTLMRIRWAIDNGERESIDAILCEAGYAPAGEEAA